MVWRNGTVLFSTVPSRRLLDGVRSALDVEALLSPSDLVRMASLAHPADQEDFVAARVLTRWLLGRLDRWRDTTGDAAHEWSFGSLSRFSIEQQCRRCEGSHGRPRVDLPGVGLSWAHAGGHVAAAVGDGEVGVDAEPVDPCCGAGRRSTHHASGEPDRRQSLVSWVRAEAVIKSGHGQLDDVARWSLDAPPAPDGRRYWIPKDGVPLQRRPLAPRRIPSLVITDLAAADADRVVCSVAAAAPARFMLPQFA